MKKIIFDLAVFLSLFITIICCMSFENDCESIRDNVLRLHIIADSDSAEAQRLKYEVRDRILAESSKLFGSTDDITAVRRSAEESLVRLEKIAEDTVKEKGYTYPVRAEITRCFFPTRQYGNIIFPAGNYNALRIILGEGEGQNWWCVMFPPICLPAATKDRSELNDVLSEKSIDIVTNSEKYQIRLWIIEKWYEAKEYFQKD